MNIKTEDLYQYTLPYVVNSNHRPNKNICEWVEIFFSDYKIVCPCNKLDSIPLQNSIKEITIYSTDPEFCFKMIIFDKFLLDNKNKNCKQIIEATKKHIKNQYESTDKII